MAITTIINHNKYDVVIKWRLTTACNLKCPYCIQNGGMTDHNARIDYDKILNVAKEINEVILRRPETSFQLNLIGGEVTLCDLKNVMKKITSPNLKLLNITTNFTRSIDYFKELADYLHSKGIKLNVTASWHERAHSLEQFIKKAEIVASYTNGFSAEMVSHKNNQDKVHEFVEKMGKTGLKFSIDIDRRKSETKYQSALFSTNKKKKNKYTVWFDDDKEPVEFATRNDLLLDKRSKSTQGSKLYTKDMYCTKGWDFLYIDSDGMAHGRDSNGSYKITPVKDFQWTLPAKCNKDYCSICGNMSLFKNNPRSEEELKYFPQNLRDVLIDGNFLD